MASKITENQLKNYLKIDKIVMFGQVSLVFFKIKLFYNLEEKTIQLLLT